MDNGHTECTQLRTVTFMCMNVSMHIRICIYISTMSKYICTYVHRAIDFPFHTFTLSVS